MTLKEKKEQLKREIAELEALEQETLEIEREEKELDNINGRPRGLSILTDLPSGEKLKVSVTMDNGKTVVYTSQKPNDLLNKVVGAMLTEANLSLSERKSAADKKKKNL